MIPRLSRSNVDRNALHRGDPVWLAEAWQRSHIVQVDPARNAVAATASGLRLIRASDDLPARRIFLGGDEEPFFAVITDLPEGLHLRQAHRGWTDRDLGLAAQALAMAQWHENHRFDPKTGAKLEPGLAGWELRADSGVVYPRTDPAIIVLIDDGQDSVLLARNVRAKEGRYACVAGFVEPGESAEAAVHREVAEETGLALDRVEYVTSQPWPFPSQLMLAFSATADPGQEIVLQPDELADARWFTEAEAREHVRGRPDVGWRGLTDVSVARFLIDRWLAGRSS
ncbi:NAD(+) diphosphatase [Natronoglycomyces albus]|uniref:NAD(+) diphosphatase n=1 Tax=Natronoglycomyces albus TaxID=2811108 RepID=A0A895XLT8_9ACTN|nr:NAD(+) diphosphatase [Natronoglycomyces albus]QSB06057.1 NAD(+) diphosphatase [Natronoglycomyces albus]